MAVQVFIFNFFSAELKNIELAIVCPMNVNNRSDNNILFTLDFSKIDKVSKGHKATLQKRGIFGILSLLWINKGHSH